MDEVVTMDGVALCVKKSNRSIQMVCRADGGGWPGDGKACAAAGKPRGWLLVGEGDERSWDAPVSCGGQDPCGTMLSPVLQPAEALAPQHGSPLGGLEALFQL